MKKTILLSPQLIGDVYVAGSTELRELEVYLTYIGTTSAESVYKDLERSDPRYNIKGDYNYWAFVLDEFTLIISPDSCTKEDLGVIPVLFEHLCFPTSVSKKNFEPSNTFNNPTHLNLRSLFPLTPELGEAEFKNPLLKLRVCCGIRPHNPDEAKYVAQKFGIAGAMKTTIMRLNKRCKIYQAFIGTVSVDSFYKDLKRNDPRRNFNGVYYYWVFVLAESTLIVMPVDSDGDTGGHEMAAYSYYPDSVELFPSTNIEGLQDHVHFKNLNLQLLSLGKIHLCNAIFHIPRFKMQHYMLYGFRPHLPAEAQYVTQDDSTVLAEEQANPRQTTSPEIRIPASTRTKPKESKECRYVLQPSGVVFELKYDGVSAPPIMNNLGLKYIHRLLINPNRDISATDLYQQEKGSPIPEYLRKQQEEITLISQKDNDKAKPIDALSCEIDPDQAINDYKTTQPAYRKTLRHKLEDLDVEFEEADLARREEIDIEKREINNLLKNIRSSLRTNAHFKSETDSTRIAVTQAIKRAIRDIRKISPEAGKYLHDNIKKGKHLKYIGNIKWNTGIKVETISRGR